MSQDEISSIREDIAELRAIIEERSKAASSHASLLRVGIGAILVQLFATVFFAGQKTQMLDGLSRDVANLQAKVETIVR